jgi:hypothetical protein
LGARPFLSIAFVDCFAAIRFSILSRRSGMLSRQIGNAVALPATQIYFHPGFKFENGMM